MTSKAIFVDADGTLINDRGLIPASARTAIAAARANGHKVFLATGRSMSELWADILDVGFDGVIAAAGGYVEIAGTVLRTRHIPRELVARVMTYFDQHGIDYFLEANTGLYGSPNCKEKLRELMFANASTPEELQQMAEGFGGFIDALQIAPPVPRDDINKVSFMNWEVPLAEIEAEFNGQFHVIPATVAAWGPNSGELSIPGVHKAAAIELVIDHLGIDIEDTFAFGDGLNDLEMLQLVAVGVAMGGAPAPVVAAANDTTGTPDEDGIATAFARYGLV